MIIRRQLLSILVATLLFAGCALFGLVQVEKGARFHQLNLRHLKYVMELSELLANHGEALPPVHSVRSVVLEIRQQPVECLKLIRPWDEWVMRAIETDVAIALCHDDIELADAVLASLDATERAQIEPAEMRARVVEAIHQFDDHSARFEDPIDRTVAFINGISTRFIPLLAGVAAFVTVALSRRISEIVSAQERSNAALVESEQLNRTLAHYDTLTGLPNRNLFNSRLDRALARSKRSQQKVGLMFVDLDRFKDVNDSLGHDAGDQLIQEAARRIESVLRKTDTVARFGGDEFVTIVEASSDLEGMMIAAQKVVDVLQEPFTIQRTNNFVTASIGLAVYPDDATESAVLLKNADIAMYEAKAQGKNRCVAYHPTLEAARTARQSYEGRLRSALDRDEFSLHYQPVVRLKGLRTCGFEALLRWTPKEGDPISPGIFIPIAEETGQIIPIGEWVLEAALDQIADWDQPCGSGFHVAVNVSGRQLLEADFAKTVDALLSRKGVSPACLDLEITESLTLTEQPLSKRTLNELSEIGVRLLMDDFGTGYSCLAHLHELPFDVLKIDSSFIRHSQGNPIAATVIGMAQALGMEVIAEGVETRQALGFLRERHCQFAQGYLFGRPVPASEVALDARFLEVAGQEALDVLEADSGSAAREWAVASSATEHRNA